MKTQKVGRIKKWTTPERKLINRLDKAEYRAAEKKAHQEALRTDATVSNTSVNEEDLV